MMLRELELADALSVVSRMRDQDRACVRALLDDITNEAFAVNRWQAHGAAWSMVDEAGLPWAIGGVNLPNSWMGIFWLVVAEGLPLESWRKLMRHTGNMLVNARDRGSSVYRHRIEAHVLADWPEAQKLVGRLGFIHEGTREGAGRNGEAIQVWAIVGPVKASA